MARLVCSLGLLTVVATAHPPRALAQADEIVEAALEAGVDEQALRGAVNTTGVPPRTYLRSVGELAPEPLADAGRARPAATAPPLPAALTARVKCIEAKESGGANVSNARGSGASGVLQYMPGTFAAHAAEMGHPEWSPWNPEQARAVAAHDLAMGRRAQWTVSGC